jgi:hypothetical protein
MFPFRMGLFLNHSIVHINLEYYIRSLYIGLSTIVRRRLPCLCRTQEQFPKQKQTETCNGKPPHFVIMTFSQSS